MWYNTWFSTLNQNLYSSLEWHWLPFELIFQDFITYINNNAFTSVTLYNDVIMFFTNWVAVFDELLLNTSSVLTLNDDNWHKNFFNIGYALPLLKNANIYLMLDNSSIMYASKTTILAQKLLSYNIAVLSVLFVYSFSIFLVYFLTIYGYENTRLNQTMQNSLLMKFFNVVDSEEEMGSADDTFVLISIFLVTFGWFFFATLFFSFFFSTQLVIFGLGVLLLVMFTLLIPTATILDFGIAYPAYIRGAGSSSNIFVECLFDFIGTLVVFTRFIVQNIRFVLIFLAYFELFEWIYTAPAMLMFTQLFQFSFQDYYLQLLNSLVNQDDTSFYYLIILVTGVINYVYHLVHLLILVFVQVTIYLLISFWLFFFFYTSFCLTKVEKFFFYKKYYTI